MMIRDTLRVLIACEFSATEREAFAALGHDAWSCDLLPTERPGNHLVGDVREFLDRGWDLMIGHPPCTFLSNSGSRWLYEGAKGTERRDEARWRDMIDGAELFRALLEAPIPRIAIENPVMHGHAQRIIGRGPDQTIQPWMFGHGEQKATCLWLKNLPRLRPTDIVAGREQRVYNLSPGPDRWRERSRAFEGIAAAMADQWGQRFPVQEALF